MVLPSHAQGCTECVKSIKLKLLHTASKVLIKPRPHRISTHGKLIQRPQDLGARQVLISVIHTYPI